MAMCLLLHRYWRQVQETAMRNVKEYLKPATIENAVTFFRERPGKGAFIAGGTDLASKKDPSLEFLIDLTYCGLDDIQEVDGQLRIGACVTLETLKESEIIKNFANGIISEVACWTGSTQLRNGATLGGTLVTTGDVALPLVAMDAQMTIMGDSERVVSLEAFFQGSETLEEGEIIQDVRIPLEFKNATGNALRMSRTRQDVSIVAVAAVTMSEDGKCSKARIAVAPVTSGIARVPEAEALLEGNSITEEIMENAADTVRQTIASVDDFRASAEYRSKVTGVYTKRVLAAC